MKKLPIIFAATTLLTSIGAFANALKNDALPFAVNVPHLRSGFEFNVEGLFLKPTNSDLDYGFISYSPGDNSQNSVLTVKPDTDFSWGVGVGYVFPDSGNDVQLNWTGFSHTDTDSFNLTALPSVSRVIHSPFGQTFDVDNVNINDDVVSASSATKFKLSAVDLNAGQYINVGNRLQLRPFAGLRFANVESNLKNTYIDDDHIGNFQHFDKEEDTFNSKFNGIGPLLGVDANYNLGGGVGASAHLASALLVGKAKTSSDFNYTELDEDNLSAILRSNDVTRVVPALDAKLGLNYSYTFDCESVVTLEGGYKVTQYIDAVDRLKGQNFDDEDPAAVSRTTSSVGFSGPYVKLAVKF